MFLSPVNVIRRAQFIYHTQRYIHECLWFLCLTCLGTKGGRKLYPTIHHQLLLVSAGLYPAQSQQPTKSKKEKLFLCPVEVVILFIHWMVWLRLTTDLVSPSPRKGGNAKQMHSTPQDKSPLPHPS